MVNACFSAAISKLMKNSTVNGLTVLSKSLLTSLYISHRQRYQLGSELLELFCRGHFIDSNQQSLAIDKYIAESIIKTSNIDQKTKEIPYKSQHIYGRG